MKERLKEGITRRDFLKVVGATAFFALTADPASVLAKPLYPEEEPDWKSTFRPKSTPEANEDLPLAPVIYRGSPEKPVVALTFDDGNFLGDIRRLLDACDKERVKLTFLPYGWPIEWDMGLWRDMVARGHDLQNHSYNHPLGIGRYSRQEVLDEIDGWQEVVDRALGYHYPAHFFRPPGGALSTSIREAAAMRDLKVVIWSGSSGIDNNDVARVKGNEEEFQKEVQRAAGNILNFSKNGAILLQHTNPIDVSSFSAIVNGLREQGLVPVQLHQVF